MSSTSSIPGAAEDSEKTPRLRGKLGAISVILAVVAVLAPLTVVSGYIPLVIGYGNGLGAPLTFVVVAVLLALFAFGYLAMARRVPKPGAFYTYIAAGLGKRVGLAAGTFTLVYYVLLAGSTVIFGGLVLNAVIAQYFGVDLPWWLCTFALIAITTVCAYRAVDFSVRVLGVIVAVEFVIVMIFNVATLAHGGAAGFSAEPFTWDSFTSGSLAIGILFAVGIFSGFETTAIYREEVRNPTRTIRRATFGVIALLAVFYFFTTYMMISAVGTQDVVADAANDPAGLFGVAATAMVGEAFSNVTGIFVVGSVLAVVLATTNVIARYVYSLSVDGVLPRAFSAVHPKHGAPSRASLLGSGLVALLVLFVAVTAVDPNLAYGAIAGVMTFGLEFLLLLVSLAVIVYFIRNAGTGESVWNRLIAPAITVLAFAVVVVITVLNAGVVLGTSVTLTVVFFVILGLSFVGGLAFAIWAAARRPEVFARIGRDLG
jgi:amino acid transporter